MSEGKIKYICKLPTNGYNPGDVAMLTDAEAANFNGGEAEPRFVLAEEEGAVDAPAVDETATEVASGSTPVEEVVTASASSTGSYEGDEVPPAPEGVNTEVPPTTPEPGVE